jgi:hypothetical protein
MREIDPRFLDSIHRKEPGSETDSVVERVIPNATVDEGRRILLALRESNQPSEMGWNAQIDTGSAANELRYCDALSQIIRA